MFANLSFTLTAGHALLLRGANGSGKTSLLRVLAGLTVADGGATMTLADTPAKLVATFGMITPVLVNALVPSVGSMV